MRGGMQQRDGATHEETVQYRTAVDRVNKANKHIIYMVAFTCAVVIAVVLYMAVTFSGTATNVTMKVNNTQQTLNKVRATQKTNSAISHCQNRAFDQVLGELLQNQPITAPPKC